MDIIAQPVSLDQMLKAANWRELITAKFPGCDLAIWEKTRRALLKGQPKRRASRNRRTSQASQQAAQGRAMAALVERVNEVDETIDQPIPFRGEPSLCPAIEVDMSIEQDW